MYQWRIKTKISATELESYQNYKINQTRPLATAIQLRSSIIFSDEHTQKQTSHGSASVENKDENQCNRVRKLSKLVYQSGIKSKISAAESKNSQNYKINQVFLQNYQNLLIYLVQHKRDAIKLCKIPFNLSGFSGFQIITMYCD